MRNVVHTGCECGYVSAMTIDIIESAFAGEIKLRFDSASDLVVVLVNP